VLASRDTSRFDYDDVPDHLDILLFGPSGAGKTSLIKTFYRALHAKSFLPEQLESILTVKDRNSNEGTTRFTKVTVKPDADDPHQTNSIVVHDTRGQIWMDEREQAQLDLLI